MKRLIWLLLFLPFIFIGCENEEKEEHEHGKADHTLTLVAQTSNELKTPESVFYCAKGDYLFVSNINGKPLDKDGNGFISKIDKNGKILNLKWVEGLDAPKGMGVYNGKLYVSDIDRLVIIDIDSAKIIDTIPVEGAKFLNDIAIDKDGNVYITDSNNNLLYKYDGDSVTIFTTGLKGANGLYLYNDSLLYTGCADRLAVVNLNNAKVNTVMKVDSKMIDGLKLVCPKEMEFLTTDWYGKIYMLEIRENEIEQIMEFPDSNKNAADIEYLADQHLVFIPTFFNNTVEIYKLSSNEEHEKDEMHEEHEHHGMMGDKDEEHEHSGMMGDKDEEHEHSGMMGDKEH